MAESQIEEAQEKVKRYIVYVNVMYDLYNEEVELSNIEEINFALMDESVTSFWILSHTKGNNISLPNAESIQPRIHTIRQLTERAEYPPNVQLRFRTPRKSTEPYA